MGIILYIACIIAEGVLLIKYFTGILNIVFGVLFLAVYLSDGLQEQLINLGIPSENLDLTLWFGLFFIVFGFVIFALKGLRQKIIDAAQQKQQ